MSRDEEDDGDDDSRTNRWLLALFWIGGPVVSGMCGYVAGRHPHFSVFAALFSFATVAVFTFTMGIDRAARFLNDILGATTDFVGIASGTGPADRRNPYSDDNEGGIRRFLDSDSEDRDEPLPFSRLLVVVAAGLVWILIVFLIARRW